MKPLADIISKHDPLLRRRFISHEFQDYGLRLAHELNDLKNKSLYIKLAKIIPRRILDEAKIAVKDAVGVKSRAKLFMWKLKQLRYPP